MSSKQSTRLRKNPNSTVIEQPPTKIAKIVKNNPGTEYVSDISNPECQSDSNGLKGEVFAQFVYNQLKHVNPGEAVTSPKIYIMIGPPGAGKSTIKRNFPITNYVNIDLDEVKKILFKCFPNNKSLYGFGIIHQLKYFAKYMLEKAIREKTNILFDTTGRMKDIMSQVIDATNNANYDQTIIIVSTSLDNCLKRAELRNKIETDREPMSEEMVKGSYESFTDPLKEKGTLSFYLIANPEIFSKAKEVYIYDNNEAVPKLVFKKVGDQVETALDYPNLYNMRINSSPPYFTMNTIGGGKKRYTHYKNKKTRKQKNKKTKKNKKISS